jgi:SOS-response transcriptional repressor LexA
MTSARREQVFAFVCRFIEQHGYSPTLDEIGAAFSFSAPAAWRHVSALLADGRLRRRQGERDRYLAIPGRVDLIPVPTDALVAELARRRAVSHARGGAK